ncbi:MAG TPA: hypothetical protein VEC60_10850 [Reyranella sp.]|nr:hypothetical protein [Reyranella sp.]
MAIVEFIEDEKVALYDHLDNLFKQSKLDDIAAATSIIDRLIADFCCEALQRNSASIFDCERNLPGTISIGGLDYALQYSELDVKNETNLPFVLSPRTTETIPKGISHIPIKLSINGKYRTASFSLPRFVNVRSELISHLVSALFWVGYSWLDDKIVQAVRSVCQSTNRNLYRYIEAMLPAPGMLDGFLFSAAADKKDFVILDDFATLRSLRLAHENARRFGRSAASIVAEVVVEVVPIEDSVIRDAAAEDRIIDIDLALDPYYTEKQSFRQALHALWGKRVTCLPVVTEGPFLLVAFFPTSKRSSLEPLLQIHKSRLREIAQANGDTLVKNLKVLASLRSSSLSEIAAVAGRFVGGFVHGYSHH